MNARSMVLGALATILAAALPAHAQADAVITPRVNTAVCESPRPTARKLKRLEAGQLYEFRVGRASGGFLEVTSPIPGFINLREVVVTFVTPTPRNARVDTVTVYKTDTLSALPAPVPPPPPIIIRPEVAPPDPAPPADTRVVPKGQFTVILLADMKYRIGKTNDTIVVPKGFVTDFASIPRALWSVLSPTMITSSLRSSMTTCTGSSRAHVSNLITC